MAKSYKEKYQESYWRWMRNTDPEATELAMKWAAEHAEEMDQLDRMLFNNNQNFSRHNYPTEPSKLEYMEKVRASLIRMITSQKMCWIAFMTISVGLSGQGICRREWIRRTVFIFPRSS